MTKTKILGIIFVLFPFFTMCQWTQQGSAISGELPDEKFGWATDMNDEGNVIIAGSYENEGNGYLSGHARVFEWNGNEWIQKGSDIDGPNPEEWSGYRVAMDGSGNTVAVTAIYGVNPNELISGDVRIYDWDGMDWVQRGAVLQGVGHPTILEWYGSGISLSADGNIVAIGGPSHSTTEGKAGFVQVFKWNGSEWEQLGNDLKSLEAFDLFGYSLELNAEGDILAVGAQGTFDFGINQEGYVKVFRWDGTNWIQQGSTLVGELQGDEFGRDVSLSSSGNVLAIGAPGYEILPSNLTSEVYVYEWDGMDWIPRGDKLVSDVEIDRFGASVSLNANGKILAVGQSVFFPIGEVRLFEWKDGSWEKLGDNIVGNENQDLFGSEVNLNAAGNKVIVGAWGNSNGGQISVFSNSSVVSAKSTKLEARLMHAYPNPTTDFLHIVDVQGKTKVNVIDVFGKQVLSNVINENYIIDFTLFPAGSYKLKLENDTTIQTELIIKN